jgi:predicted MFS family arabinose efflux permease
MLPVRVLRDRARGGAYATTFFVGVGMFATFYFLTLYIQQVLGYSAIRAGLSYLPFNVGVGIMAALGSRLVAKVPPRAITTPGLVVAAAGMWWLSTLTPKSAYLTALMPAMFLVALGLGAAFVPMAVCAVRGVADSDSGIASAVLNTAQQIGGALGLGVLATLSQSHRGAFLGAGAAFLVAALIVATVVNAGPQKART